MAVGLLLMAAVNAISYFVRSADWSSLIAGCLGRPKSMDESVGFPLKVWEAGNQYGGLFVDYTNLAANIAFAAFVGSIIGWIAIRKCDFLNATIDSMELAIPASDPQFADRKHSPIQFSLQGLMITTTIVAVAVAVVSKLAAHPMTLIGIYVLGPIGLVTLAMIPQRLSWQHRVVLLIPIALGLIVIAILVGQFAQHGI